MWNLSHHYHLERQHKGKGTRFLPQVIEKTILGDALLDFMLINKKAVWLGIQGVVFPVVITR